MDRDSRPKGRHPRASGTFVGIVIVLIGTLMLLDTLGVLHGRTAWDFVPALIMTLGLIRIVEAKGGTAGTIVGLLITTAGTLWLLDNLDIIRFNAALLWPLILIGAGVGMIAKRFDPNRSGRTGTPSSTPVAIFGGSKRSMNDPDFAGTDALAIFGGVDIDLRPCKITRSQAVVDANAIFGGVDLQVPPEWNVVIRGTAIFGGYGDNTVHPPEGAPELVVTGVAIFGGINIKN